MYILAQAMDATLAGIIRGMLVSNTPACHLVR